MHRILRAIAGAVALALGTAGCGGETESIESLSRADRQSLAAIDFAAGEFNSAHESWIDASNRTQRAFVAQAPQHLRVMERATVDLQTAAPKIEDAELGRAAAARLRYQREIVVAAGGLVRAVRERRGVRAALATYDAAAKRDADIEEIKTYVDKLGPTGR